MLETLEATWAARSWGPDMLPTVRRNYENDLVGAAVLWPPEIPAHAIF